MEERKNLAVSVDASTYDAVCALSERLQMSKRKVIRAAVKSLAMIHDQPRRETRPAPTQCCHGTDGQHDE
jgi:hypothetical protein